MFSLITPARGNQVPLASQTRIIWINMYDDKMLSTIHNRAAVAADPSGPLLWCLDYKERRENSAGVN